MNLANVRHRLELDMRYGNQLAQTSVVTHLKRMQGSADALHVINQFAQDYQKRFGEGSAQPKAGVVVTCVRVATYCDDRKIDFSALRRPVESRSDLLAPPASRNCYFQAAPDGVDTPVFAFEALKPGHVLDGPAVVVSNVTTILVEPGWRFTMGHEGSAWMNVNR